MTGALGARNPRIARLRRLSGRRSARADDGAFVIEGLVLVAEAVNARIEIESVYADSAVLDETRAIVGEHAEVIEVEDGVVAAASSTVTSRPVIAVAPFVTRPAADVLAGATFVVCCAAVADPGNLGTILRTAEAAGADAVVLTAGSVDVHSPKVVRASAGALFHVPVAAPVMFDDLRAAGLAVVGTRADGGVAYDEMDWRRPFALVLGNEAHGVGADVELDAWVSIPHVGRAESLNVAMAAAVLAFEAARQRSALRQGHVPPGKHGRPGQAPGHA